MPHDLSPPQVSFLETYLNYKPANAPATRDIPSPGTVAKRSYLIARWKKMQIEIEAETDALASAVETLVVIEDPSEIRAGVTAALRRLIDDILTTVSDAVDTSINDGDPKYRAVAKAASAGRASVGSDPLLRALSENTLMAGGGFAAAILRGLDDIEAKLTA
ncbi:MAG: hypothetical protein AAF214_02090 [Pseudomonadota bacterium]